MRTDIWRDGSDNGVYVIPQHACAEISAARDWLVRRRRHRHQLRLIGRHRRAQCVDWRLQNGAKMLTLHQPGLRQPALTLIIKVQKCVLLKKLLIRHILYFRSM